MAELILPVVDCSFGSLYWSDNTTVRFFYLIRFLSDINSVFIVVVSMGMQDMQTMGQVDERPAAVATVAAISNLTARSIDHRFMVAKGYPYEAASFEVYTYLSKTPDSLWKLQRVPSDASAVATVVTTSYRLGIYITEETNQANYKNLLWALPDDPLDFINYWRWIGRPVLRNSWAWLHCIHFYLATDLMLKLYLLCLTSAVHIKKGRLWIADAFSSISTTLAWLAPVVILSWALEKGWTLLELAVYDGNMITQTQSVYIRISIVRADMMVLCFSIAAQVGNLFKARVDPAVTALVFNLVFECRRSIIQLFPSLKESITSYTDDDYNLGKDASENVQMISPLARWSTHEISKYPVKFVFASVSLVLGSFLLVLVVYTLVHKVYRFYLPMQLQVKFMTNRSMNEEELLKQQRTLTIFELSTGAELLNRYGLLSDYSNYIFIKGTKFATTDGIYASGFAIANDKFVLKSRDLRTIWFMKLTGVRFSDVYLHDVSDRVVSQTARLVHPGTLTFQDLTQISISKLA